MLNPVYDKRVLCLLLISLIFTGCKNLISAQEEPLARANSPHPTFGVVSEAFLKGKLSVLAHDSLMGRGTGQPGSAKAADYLYHFYRSEVFAELKGFHVMRQPFELQGVFWDGSRYRLYQDVDSDTLVISDTKLNKGGVACFVPLMEGHGSSDAPVVFAGSFSGLFSEDPNGSIQAAVPGVETENAWVMIFGKNYPVGNSEKKQLLENERDTAVESWENPDGSNQKNVTSGLTRSEKVRLISGYYGAAGVIFIDDNDVLLWEESAKKISRSLERPLAVKKEGSFRSVDIPRGASLSVRPDCAAQILGIPDTDLLDSIYHHWQKPDVPDTLWNTGIRLLNQPEMNRRTFLEENIIAVIPGFYAVNDGSGKTEADNATFLNGQSFHSHEYGETIVLSAHYDHMGLGEPDDSRDIIYNGADDNGSGTAVLMQIAAVFAEQSAGGHHPSRTMIFLHTAAEEWGLLGARHFVDNPIVPLSDVIANINVDMVGSVDDNPSRETDSNYVYIIGAGLVSEKLGHLAERANRNSAQMNLLADYNSQYHPLQLHRRSDHWAFAQKNIPFVFFFSGLHEHYHRPSDTKEKIDVTLLTARARLITELTHLVSESPDPPRWDGWQPGR